MLSKGHRLKSRQAFKKTLASRRFCSNDTVVVYGLATSDRPVGVSWRFGFIVSKKIHKRAVRRNRIKRRMREIVRHDVLKLLAERQSDIDTFVIIARQGSLEASYQSLRQKLLGCFTKIIPPAK